MKIASIVGARPNFMKIAPFVRELSAYGGIEHLLIHTGQHYDERLSDVFFRQLDLPEPDKNLGVGSGSHSFQTAEVMIRLEPVLLQYQPDLVVVVGDVNSTLAAALVATKLRIPVAHIEAGLRSFDNNMPEEINRKLTDAVADFLFVTEESGVQNLRREGISDENIFLVGNVMIDTLLRHRETASQSQILKKFHLLGGQDGARPYGVLTLHRPSNVDQPDVLRSVLSAVATIANEFPVFFPIHPRTQENILSAGLEHLMCEAELKAPRRGIIPLPPLPYLDFLCLMDNARIILTDSGGIQEESTVLQLPCLTLRENTERPITIEQGTNQLVGTDPEKIIGAAKAILARPPQEFPTPPLWDGRAAQRIVRCLVERLQPDLAV